MENPPAAEPFNIWAGSSDDVSNNVKRGMIWDAEEDEIKGMEEIVRMDEAEKEKLWKLVAGRLKFEIGHGKIPKSFAALPPPSDSYFWVPWTSNLPLPLRCHRCSHVVSQSAPVLFRLLSPYLMDVNFTFRGKEPTIKYFLDNDPGLCYFDCPNCSSEIALKVTTRRNLTRWEALCWGTFISERGQEVQDVDCIEIADGSSVVLSTPGASSD